MGTATRLEFHALTPSRWDDFEELFGPRGACGGCWCMFWRLARKEFDSGKGEANRSAMHALVQGGEIPGILAYAEGRPVGWCAVAPRERYPALERSKILGRIDDAPVWSVTCFFIKKEQRNRGMTVRLLRAALAHVKAQGGTIVEGYPLDPGPDRLVDAFAWHGIESAFTQAGFRECARPSPKRPIMRRLLRTKAGASPTKGSASRPLRSAAATGKSGRNDATRSTMHAEDSITAYIATFPAPIQRLLKTMRKTIREEAPDALEKISYGMPTFHQGRNLVHFAAFKNHIGFYPTASGVAAFEPELAGYVHTAGAIQFPLDKPLPLDLVRRIVRFRLSEETSRQIGPSSKKAPSSRKDRGA